MTRALRDDFRLPGDPPSFWQERQPAPIWKPFPDLIRPLVKSIIERHSELLAIEVLP